MVQEQVSNHEERGRKKGLKDGNPFKEVLEESKQTGTRVPKGPGLREDGRSGPIGIWRRLVRGSNLD